MPAPVHQCKPGTALSAAQAMELDKDPAFDPYTISCPACRSTFKFLSKRPRPYKNWGPRT